MKAGRYLKYRAGGGSGPGDWHIRVGGAHRDRRLNPFPPTRKKGLGKTMEMNELCRQKFIKPHAREAPSNYPHPHPPIAYSGRQISGPFWFNVGIPSEMGVCLFVTEAHLNRGYCLAKISFADKGRARMGSGWVQGGGVIGKFNKR